MSGCMFCSCCAVFVAAAFVAAAFVAAAFVAAAQAFERRRHSPSHGGGAAAVHVRPGKGLLRAIPHGSVKVHRRRSSAQTGL